MQGSWKKRLLILFILLFTGFLSYCLGDGVLITSFEDQKSEAFLEPVRYNDGSAVAVVFKGTDDLHYYADSATAPGPGLELKVKLSGEGISFGAPIFPESDVFYDSALEKNVDVYAGQFKVIVPIEESTDSTVSVKAVITGIACTSKLCLAPFEKEVEKSINMGNSQSWALVSMEVDKTGVQSEASSALKGDKAATSVQGTGSANYSWPWAFGIALLAGVLLNVMPCVWPIIPIIITRLWNQAGNNKAKSFSLGLWFSAGILLFFGALAVLNIVLKVGFGAVFQWGDLLRNEIFLAAMVFLMLILGLFMFGIFNIFVPASVSSKASSGASNFSGTVVMGFLAAILATPCSFGILAAAVAWAQTQNLAIATFTIMIIGVGMSLPYVFLTSIPGLVNKMPKPGGWMEKVKIITGFILLAVAVKLLTALSPDFRKNVLYYSVLLAFCVWVWGTWITLSTSTAKKWFIRGVVLIIVFWGGWAILPVKKDLIDWQSYDRAKIESLLEDNEPVLIKFTADWCTNCTIVKKRVYENRDIAELIKKKNVAAFMGDTTLDDYQATKDLYGIYREPGVPVSVIHKPDGEAVKLRGIIDKSTLEEVLEEIGEDAKN